MKDKQQIRKERTVKANNEQTKLMNDYKWMKGIELGRDPGQEAIDEWIKLNAKRFRKNFTLKDLRGSLEQLQIVRKAIRERLAEILRLTKTLEDRENEIMCDIEDLEEEDNGKK
jgi:hypothetical protein